MSSPLPNENPPRTSWLECAMIAGLSTVSMFFGASLHSCAGVGQAMGATILFFALFMIAVPGILLAVCAVVAVMSFSLRALSANGWIRENTALLAFILPLVAGVAGYTISYAGGTQGKCSIGHT